MTGPARITAAYDDGPQLFKFAPAVPPAVAAAVPVDREAVRETLAGALAGLCGAPASIKLEDTEVGRLDWHQRGDGLAIGLRGGGKIAAALLSRDCGGGFAADHNGGASVERLREGLTARLRIAVAAIFPGEGGWAPGNGAPGETFAAHIEVGGVRDRIDLGVAVPLPGPDAPVDHGDWQLRLALALDRLAVPVRLVLHESVLSVGAARALAVGDVLPIATAHEVGLRIGSFTVARGRIAADAVEITRRMNQEQP